MLVSDKTNLRRGRAAFVASPYDKTPPIQVHKTGHGVPSTILPRPVDRGPRARAHEQYSTHSCPIYSAPWSQFVLDGFCSGHGPWTEQGLLYLIATVEPQDQGPGTPRSQGRASR